MGKRARRARDVSDSKLQKKISGLTDQIRRKEEEFESVKRIASEAAEMIRASLGPGDFFDVQAHWDGYELPRLRNELKDLRRRLCELEKKC